MKVNVTKIEGNQISVEFCGAEGTDYITLPFFSAADLFDQLGEIIVNEPEEI